MDLCSNQCFTDLTVKLLTSVDKMPSQVLCRILKPTSFEKQPFPLDITYMEEIIPLLWLTMPLLCVHLSFLIRVLIWKKLIHLLSTEPDIGDGDLDGLLMPLILGKSTVATLLVIVRREGVQRKRDAEICVALSASVGDLSIKIAAGISAVMSTIVYAHQTGNIVLNA